MIVLLDTPTFPIFPSIHYGISDCLGEYLSPNTMLKNVVCSSILHFNLDYDFTTPVNICVRTNKAGKYEGPPVLGYLEAK